jgi:hypothetical protein
LPFAATDVEFDPVRAYMYAIDRVNKRAYFIDLSTGLIVRQFTLEFMPQALTVAPDGSRLFVALAAREDNCCWDDEDGHEGYIASFDLVTHLKDREFRIAEDPFDIVATNNGHLIVSSGSGQHTFVRAFDAVTGSETGAAAGVYEQTKLALHPSQTRVYGADTTIGPSDIERIDVTAAGGLTYRGDSIYHGDHRMNGNVWSSPLGDILFTRGGDVFTSTLDIAQDMRFVRSMTVGNIEALSFSTSLNLVMTGEGSTVNTYSLQTFEKVGSQPLDHFVNFLGDNESNAYAVGVESGETFIDVFPIPQTIPATPTTTSTATATATATNTSLPPTNTPIPSETPTHTATPVPPTSTATATATNTAMPATDTPTSTPTNTAVPATGTPTATSEPATNTPTRTTIPAAHTQTPTATATSTTVATASHTITPPPRTPPAEATARVTRTVVATKTVSSTKTVAPKTVAPTRTVAATRTTLPTRTPTPRCLKWNEKLTLLWGIAHTIGAESGERAYRTKFDINHDGIIDLEDWRRVLQSPGCRKQR